MRSYYIGGPIRTGLAPCHSLPPSPLTPGEVVDVIGIAMSVISAIWAVKDYLARRAESRERTRHDRVVEKAIENECRRLVLDPKTGNAIGVELSSEAVRY